MAEEESQVFRSGANEEAGVTEGRSKKKKQKLEGPTDQRNLQDAQGGPSDRREMHDSEGVIDGRNMHDAEGPSDGRSMHDAEGGFDGRHMRDAEDLIAGSAEHGTDSVEDLLAWAGVQGAVNPRDMQDAEGPSNKRSMHDADGPSDGHNMQDGEGPSDKRSLQDHYVTIDSTPVERKTVELGKRIDPSMAEPALAAAPAKKEPLFTMADATPWAISLGLEARLKNVGSKTSELHNQIDRLEVDALNLGKRIKI